MKDTQKLPLVVGSVMLCGVTAWAYLLVDWGATAGFYRTNDPTRGILDPVYGVTQTIAQLIFSTDATIDPPDPNNVAGGYVSGDDVVYDTRVFNYPTNSDTWASTWLQFHSNVFTPGYLYCRIFQDDTPAIGEAYYDTVLYTAQDAGDPPASMSIEMNTDLVNGNGLDQVIPIPEPLSAALYGLGTLLILHRRRKV